MLVDGVNNNLKKQWCMGMLLEYVMKVVAVLSTAKSSDAPNLERHGEVTTFEYALNGLAILVILGLVINLAILLMLTRIGIVSLFALIFVTALALPSGTVLLTVNLLYPGSVIVNGLVGLLWLVGPAAVACVLLFDFLLERLVLRALKSAGLGLPRIWLAEAVLVGFALALSLIVAASFLPQTELSWETALVAGQIGAFVRYYLGLWLQDTDFGGDTDFMDDIDLEGAD